jgi:hypothetical protein
VIVRDRLALVAITVSVGIPVTGRSFSTPYTPPSGRTIAVGTSGDFEAGLKAAQPGDVIARSSRARCFPGNFSLPDGWWVSAKI